MSLLPVRCHNSVIKMQKYSESDERGEFEMTQLACRREGGVGNRPTAPSLGTLYTVMQYLIQPGGGTIVSVRPRQVAVLCLEPAQAASLNRMEK